MMSFSVFPCDVLCIGAGREQVAGIRKAQSLGLTVLAVDRNPDAEGLKVAEQGLPLDPADVKKLVDVAHKAEIRAIVPVPVGSVLLESSGIVNTELGLRGAQKNATSLSADKAAMRKILADAGLLQPVCREVNDLSDLLGICNTVGFPVVVKPNRGSGSRDVLLLHNQSEVKREISRIKKSSLLVESAILGEEFGFDAAVIGRLREGGIFQPLILRNKIISEPPLRFCHSTSGPAPESQFETVSGVLEKACVAIGYSDCLVNADVMVNGHGEAVIIEMVPRPAGYGISQHLLPVILGVDPCVEMLKMLIGEGGADFSPKRSGFGFVRQLPVPSGRFAHIDGLEKARSLQGVVELGCNLCPGDQVTEDALADSLIANCYAIIASESYLEAEAVWESVITMINVVVDTIR